VIIITSTIRDTTEKLQSLEYAHSYIWKKEGKYTKGIRKGMITITQPKGTILEQQWTEDKKIDTDNETWEYLTSAHSTTPKRIISY
jgi:hypothetical protein